MQPIFRKPSLLLTQFYMNCLAMNALKILINRTFLVFKYSLLLVATCFNTKAGEVSTFSFSVAAPNSKPYIYKSDNGEYQGFLVEYFSLIKEKTGIDIRITVLPWARGMNAVKFGQLDALILTFYTEERGEFLTFPDESILDIYTVLLKRRSDNLSIKSIADIDPEKRVAKRRAMSMGKKFDDAEKAGKINVIEVRDLEHAIQMLVHSRVDLVATAEYVSAYELNRLALNDKIEVIKVSDGRVPSFLAFSTKYSEKHDVNVIMKRINQVVMTPEYQKLVHKYLIANDQIQ